MIFLLHFYVNKLNYLQNSFHVKENLSSNYCIPSHKIHTSKQKSFPVYINNRSILI